MIINTAYIDPSVMTYAIQAVAGVAIAIGAVAAVFWRKAKKKVSDKLGIDENANKEVEDDIQLTDGDAQESTDTQPENNSDETSAEEAKTEE